MSFCCLFSSFFPLFFVFHSFFVFFVLHVFFQIVCFSIGQFIFVCLYCDIKVLTFYLYTGAFSSTSASPCKSIPSAYRLFFIFLCYLCVILPTFFYHIIYYLIYYSFIHPFFLFFFLTFSVYRFRWLSVTW